MKSSTETGDAGMARCNADYGISCGFLPLRLWQIETRPNPNANCVASERRRSQTTDTRLLGFADDRRAVHVAHKVRRRERRGARQRLSQISRSLPCHCGSRQLRPRLRNCRGLNRRFRRWATQDEVELLHVNPSLPRCDIEAVERDLTVVHDEQHVADVTDVGKRTAVDRHEVCFVTRSYRADTLLRADAFRRHRRASLDCIHRREPGLGESNDFAPPSADSTAGNSPYQCRPQS